jgi:hypothetical protein
MSNTTMTATALKALYEKATQAKLAFYRSWTRSDGPWTEEAIAAYDDLSDLAEAAFLEWRSAVTGMTPTAIAAKINDSIHSARD